MAPPQLGDIVNLLRKHYGRPKPPITSDPFELLLLEKSGYLAPDEKRERAFLELKKRVGASTKEILDAPFVLLTKIAATGGIHAGARAVRMKQCAELALREPLDKVLKLDLKSARKAIEKYPMIGEPGAEKILLFSGAHPALGLESNGLRVAVRLGWGEEHKNYSTMYRRTRDAIDIAGWTCKELIPAHQLLRQHGQETCRRTDPACGVCPLRATCAFADARSTAS